MKTEIWLRANRRIFGLALAVYGAIALSALLAVVGGVALGGATWLIAAASIVLAFSLLGVAWLAIQMNRPRLGYRSGDLLVYVRQGHPARISVADIECFLLGRGPTLLPGRQFAESETVTLVVRISPKIEALRQQPTDYRLGSWCDSHITLRGTWCEPLSVARVNDLNARLAAAQKAVKAAAVSSSQQGASR
ncbi:MAG: hypothetical protein AB7U73_04460 [Pirellulales bacterium]